MERLFLLRLARFSFPSNPLDISRTESYPPALLPLVRRTLLLMAGTILFFAIATLPVGAYWGADHVRALWAGGLASSLSVFSGALATRWTIRSFGGGHQVPTVSILLGPVIRLLVILTSLVAVPLLISLPMGAFAGWLIASYLAILFVESVFLASEAYEQRT